MINEGRWPSCSFVNYPFLQEQCSRCIYTYVILITIYCCTYLFRGGRHFGPTSAIHQRIIALITLKVLVDGQDLRAVQFHDKIAPCHLIPDRAICAFPIGMPGLLPAAPGYASRSSERYSSCERELFCF